MPRPTVIVLASQKGGVGKTALSAHLAVAAEMTGAGPVVLYDTDPQQSLAEWWRERDANTPQLAKGGIPELPATLDRLGEAGARLVIIDTPPGPDRRHSVRDAVCEFRTGADPGWHHRPKGDRPHSAAHPRAGSSVCVRPDICQAGTSQ